MDFFSLSRKELQFLSKKNKIPANQTNLAMAEALSSLSQVEGLDEIMNPVEAYPNQFEEEKGIETPNVHHSRTSTRRKDVNVTGAVSAMRSVSTRKTKKDALVESDEQKIGDILKTPAAATTTTSRYNTRRSTRFLEKNLSKMSSLDSGDIVGSVKFDDVSQQTQESVEPQENDSDLKLVESSKPCNDSIEVKEMQEDNETELAEPVDSSAPMEVTNQAVDAFNSPVESPVVDASMDVTDNEGRSEVVSMEVAADHVVADLTVDVAVNASVEVPIDTLVTDNEGCNEVASMEITADDVVADLATNTLADGDVSIPEEIVITKQESTISVETMKGNITDVPIFQQKTTDIVSDQLKGESYFYSPDQVAPKDIGDEHIEEEDQNTMKENSLQDMSIAQLKKMLKKLTIDGNPKSKDNDAGKEMVMKRIALQPVAENKMLDGETQNGY